DDREAEGDRLLSGYTTICGVLPTQSGWSRRFGLVRKLSSYRRASQWIIGQRTVVWSGPEPEAGDVGNPVALSSGARTGGRLGAEDRPPDQQPLAGPHRAGRLSGRVTPPGSTGAGWKSVHWPVV